PIVLSIIVVMILLVLIYNLFPYTTLFRSEIEKLLKEYCSQNQNTIVDSIHYHQSFAEYIDGIELPHNNNRAFHYRNNLIRFQGRSEEHTSELQSRFDLVCRLLLEKKKNII